MSKSMSYYSTLFVLLLSTDFLACDLDANEPPAPAPAPTPTPTPPPPPPPEAACGDYACNGDENCDTCPGDCGECGPVCQDGYCDTGESCQECPADCGVCNPNDARLTVNNLSGNEIFYLYVSPCDSSTWGPDQLGFRTIPSGGTFTLTNIDPGCYDLRAEDFGPVFYWERFGDFFDPGEDFVWTLLP